MSEQMEPIERARLEAQRLMDTTPPQFHDPNKAVVYGISCPPGAVHRGSIDYSRWAAMPLPPHIDPTSAAARATGRPGYFDYVPVVEGAVEWHVNFADPHLFVAYGSSLFAQDEMQVTEHPALGAIREALSARGLRAVTVEAGEPTPALVMGVERRCAVATESNAVEGRPLGLYGNAFCVLPAEAVVRATTAIDPATITNLIAIAAPRPSYGTYTREQIEDALVTAYSGFRAAALESERAFGAEAPVVIHTGFWGCGAFGGNRVLMVMLQACAAELAGVDGSCSTRGTQAVRLSCPRADRARGSRERRRRSVARTGHLRGGDGGVRVGRERWQLGGADWSRRWNVHCSGTSSTTSLSCCRTPRRGMSSWSST